MVELHACMLTSFKSPWVEALIVRAKECSALCSFSSGLYYVDSQDLISHKHESNAKLLLIVSNDLQRQTQQSFPIFPTLAPSVPILCRQKSDKVQKISGDGDSPPPPGNPFSYLLLIQNI